MDTIIKESSPLAYYNTKSTKVLLFGGKSKGNEPDV